MKVSDLVEAVLAILVVGGIVTIAIFDSVTRQAVSIPQELIGFGLLVLGSYFRGRSGNGTNADLIKALQASVPAPPGSAMPPAA